MEVTALTWIIAIIGILIISWLDRVQLAARRPRSNWVIENVYSRRPDATDSAAYLAFNRWYAWADALFWMPLQIAGSIGMLLGKRWGILLGLMASVPFWYSATPLFIWDRDLGFRQSTTVYWVFVRGMFPVFGIVEGVFCFRRLLE